MAFDARAVGNRHRAGAGGHVAGGDLARGAAGHLDDLHRLPVHGQRLRRHRLAVDGGAGQRLAGEAGWQHHRLRFRSRRAR